MRVAALLLSLVPLLAYSETVGLAPVSLPAKGGWSLQMEIGGSCPAGTKACFSDQTGVSSVFNRTGVEGTFDRGEECCPFGTEPRLDCGTYVNNGQPYACCPLGNADCRGDVEDPQRQGNELCANPGWALWQIPDGGFNMFCCLPGQYGYWYKNLGQDAVGICSISSTLPEGSTPGVQFNNGDGSVSPSGIQLSPLPTPMPTPAPVCDITHYGWSLQIPSSSSCTTGSHLCPSGGSCCPNSLNCGTVIGDSEVPVCCPPHNPDCRGDVEGLWPQFCADSSWALWHVNTNGNHFCCLPDQVGYNVPSDNAALGFCGSKVPNGTMRSILDYVGDGSAPGSFAHFPCDSSPAPNNSYSSIVGQILNPPPTLNPLPGPTTTSSPLRALSGATGGISIPHTSLNPLPFPNPSETLPLTLSLPIVSAKYHNATYMSTYTPAVETAIKQWVSTTLICPPGASEAVLVVLQSHVSGGVEVTNAKTVGPVTVTTERGVVKTIVTADGGVQVVLRSPAPSVSASASVSQGQVTSQAGGIVGATEVVKVSAGPSAMSTIAGAGAGAFTGGAATLSHGLMGIGTVCCLALMGIYGVFG